MIDWMNLVEEIWGGSLSDFNVASFNTVSVLVVKFDFYKNFGFDFLIKMSHETAI